MKYRDTYRIVTQVSRYVSHRDFRYRATPNMHTHHMYISEEEDTQSPHQLTNLSGFNTIAIQLPCNGSWIAPEQGSPGRIGSVSCVILYFVQYPS